MTVLLQAFREEMDYDEALEAFSAISDHHSVSLIEQASNQGTILELNDISVLPKKYKVSGKRNIHKHGISAITVTGDEVAVRIESEGYYCQRELISNIFSTLYDSNIKIDIINKNEQGYDKFDVFFTLCRENFSSCLAILMDYAPYMDFTVNQDIVKISIIGSGLKYDIALASRINRLLSKEKISVKLLRTSGIRMDLILTAGQEERVFALLKREFEF